MNRITRLQNRITRTDIAALLVFAAVWIWYIWSLRYGFSYADESMYLTLGQRLAHGDRLIVDEWSPGQLSGFWMWAPYKFYVLLNGSSDGIILFSRYLFLAVNAVFFWVIYTRLRAYGWQALTATVLFCLYVPLLFFSCSYYTLAVRLLMVVCLLLFSEKQTPASLLLAGVLLSLAVINQPAFALLYFFFTVLVWIRFFRQKKGKRFLDDFAFCLHTRAWKYITVSVFVCATAFVCRLLIRCGMRNILTYLPFFWDNPDLDFSAQGDMKGIFFDKFVQAIDYYGLVCLIPALVIAAISIAYARGFFRSRRETVRKILFALAFVVWVISCVQAFRIFNRPKADVFFTVYPAPMLWLGFVCYLLCEHKNKRFLLFWTVGLVSSLCIDVSSHTTLSLGSPIAYIADVIFFTDLVRELRAEFLPKKGQKTHRSRKTPRANKTKLAGCRWIRLIYCCFAVWFGFILLIDNTIFSECFSIGTPPNSLQYVCARGPWRSLHVSQVVKTEYDLHLADVDAILERQPGNLCVCGMAPELYLYADLPYATYCSELYHQTPYVDRLVLYWTMHPERLPECIYVPFYDAGGTLCADKDKEDVFTAWIRESFDSLCDYTSELGEGGYILYVSQWHLDAEGGSK